MTKPTRCLEALVALAFALGARALPAEDQVIQDNFVEDPDYTDGEPLTWATDQNPCCPAKVEAKAGEGMLISPLSGPPGQAATMEVFAGDVTLQAQVRGDENWRANWLGIHWDPFAISGYTGVVDSTGTVYLQRYNGPAEEEFVSHLAFDPTAGDLLLELRSVGALVEFRVWLEDTERPADPILTMQNSVYRTGSVGLAAQFAPSIFRWVKITAPPHCDTHCDGIDVAPISDSGNNVRVTAQASDDTGDPIFYTFIARRGASVAQELGPQREPVADFALPPGTYSIRVAVSDGSDCSPVAPDAVCRRTGYVVPEPPRPSLQLPGDCNQDRRLDISDAVCVLGFLFLGAPTRLPCGDGEAASAPNRVLLDWQPDGKVDLSDVVGLLQFLFTGGPPHSLGSDCAEIAGCPDGCAG